MQKLSTNKNSGFTLIEMMMVVALIAILSAVALPAYNGYVNRSKIKTAQADLVALSLNFENSYQRKLSYPTATFPNTSALTDEFKGWSPASDPNTFSFASTVATGSTYTIVATGSGGVSGCNVSLTNGGVRSINSTCKYSTGGNWL